MSVKINNQGPMGVCHYCAKTTYSQGSHPAIADAFCTGTRDHVTPRRLACVDATVTDNYVHACFGCNQIKADHPYEVFVFWLKTAPQGSWRARNDSFKDFIFALTMAGFRSAMALAIVDRRKGETRTLPRAANGRFTVRSLRAHQRAERARA